MPVSFVNSAVPGGNPTTSLTITIPAVNIGDKLVLAFVSRDHTSATAKATVTDNDTDGNLWTETYVDTASRKANIYEKIATANTSAKTITVSGCVGSCAGVLKIFRGMATTVPNVDWQAQSNAAGTESVSSMTPLQSDPIVCGIIFNTANDNAVTNLAFAVDGNMTVTEKLSTGGSDCGVAFGHVGPVSGRHSTGSMTWTQVDGTTISVILAIDPPVVNATMTCEVVAMTAASPNGDILSDSIIEAQLITASAVADAVAWLAYNHRPRISRKAGNVFRGWF